MNPETDHDEKPLRQLFDATAERPSGPTLTRLAARAREIPDRVQRTPQWLPRWAWAPSFAGVAVAIGALLATVLPALDNSNEEPSLVLPHNRDVVARQSDSAARALPSSNPEEQIATPVTLEDPMTLHDIAPLDYTLVAMHSDWDFEDPLNSSALDPLYAVPANSKLDAWLYATAQLLGDGAR